MKNFKTLIVAAFACSIIFVSCGPTHSQAGHQENIDLYHSIKGVK